MTSARRISLALAATLALPAALAVSAEARAGTVSVIRIDGGINPAIGDYVRKALSQAEAEGSTALVIELDTPGGLVSTTKDIVTDILNAKIPVVVFVSPRGAWAASAGTFITLAGHVAAMAPGSTIGAAHPVSIGGSNPKPPSPAEGEDEGEKPGSGHGDFMDEKVENLTIAFIEEIAKARERNVEWAANAVRNSVAIGAGEALERKVIDLVADDLSDLLAKIDGRSVKVVGGEVKLATREARVERIEMEILNRIFAVLGDPEIVGLLFMLGVVGLYIELQNPGLIVPGAVGAVCLLLAATALQIIPFNWVGLLLVLGGVALLIAEVHLTSFGVLFTLGIVALGLGAWLVFRVPELSDLALPFWSAIFPALAVLGAVFAGLAFAVSRTQLRPQYAGAELLATELGVADSDLAPEGRVLIRGELWKAIADAPIQRGERIRVTRVRDLVLHVRRAEPTE